jgi:polycystin 2
MACEGVYILFILYYLVEETLEILKIRGAYFKSVYNNLDIVVVILSIGNQGLSIYTFFVVENQVTFFLTKLVFI